MWSDSADAVMKVVFCLVGIILLMIAIGGPKAC